MKLSTRSTYGVRAMLALALQPPGSGPLMVKDIAGQQKLPATYLEQLMVLLRKAGLVTAIRGAHGGYTLARQAAEITLLEIIEVLEGPLSLTDCPTDAGCCGHPETCVLQDLWQQASQALIGVFSKITLATLAEQQRTRVAGAALMYSI